MPRLIQLLSSNDKDVKHASWEVIQEMIEKGSFNDKETFLSLLCYPDEGSRYRVWNLVPKVLNNMISEGELLSRADCLSQLLKSNNLEVRALAWYQTLPPLLHVLRKIPCSIINYCESIGGEWKELVSESCNEVRKVCSEN